MLTVESRKSTNFRVSPRMELLAKFILLLAPTSATSPETDYRPTTFLKNFVESLFLAGDPLMQASNVPALLSLFTILLGYLGLTISWSLK